MVNYDHSQHPSALTGADHNIMTIKFTGRHFPDEIILQSVRYYISCKLSHQKVKGKMHQCLGWKSNEGASSTQAGVELWSITNNGQLNNPEGLSAWEQFYALAA
ncbi:hypothetical protein DS893_01195 [Vibrionales bacterium C3R12]|nr:hypothetical protein DS893_01195 [Vibrionales bacterium C3R12]